MLSIQTYRSQYDKYPIACYNDVRIPRFLVIEDRPNNILRYDEYIEGHQRYECHDCSHVSIRMFICIQSQRAYDPMRQSIYLCVDCFDRKLRNIGSALIVPNSRDSLTFEFIRRFSKDNLIYAIWLYIMWRRRDNIISSLPKDIIGDISKYILFYKI